MPAPDPLRTRRLVGWLAALAVVVGLGAAVPATSSAFTAVVTNSRDTAAAKAVFTCADLFAGTTRKRTAYFEYPLREDASTTVAADSSAQGNTGTYAGAHGKDESSPRPCPADPGSPYALDGSSSRVLSSQRFDPIRGEFSVEIWFKTSARSEKIMGFEGQQSGTSSNYDKHLYVDDGGLLRFAIYNSDGDTTTANSTARVDDGLWHQAVATASSAAGSVLYLDGVKVGSNPKSVAEDFGGYWRIGEGNTGGWPSAPQGTSYFTGSLSFAAAYATVLSAADVRAAYAIGRPGPVSTPAATATPAPTDTPAPTASPTATPAATQTSSAPVATAAPHPAETAILVDPGQQSAAGTSSSG